MFYLTAAHREGWPEAGIIGYRNMQAAVDAGYLGIARELHVAISPVGDAWSAVLDRKSHPELWEADGSHPTIDGTYLAACVFYAAVFHESPKGVRYYDGLSRGDAAMLQVVASEVVLGSELS